MNSKLLGSLLLVVIVVGMVYYLLSNKQVAPAPVSTMPVTTAPIGPQPTAVNVTKLNGQVVSISGEKLILSVNGKNQDVSLSGALSFEKVLSGSIESGKANLAFAKLGDIAPGQTLLITYNQQTGKVRTVFIEK